MYSAVLSVLLMGMFPFLQQSNAGMPPIASLPIAPPSPLAESFPGTAFRSVSASGIVVLDLRSGQQVFGRNADGRRSVGSLVKLMTALVIVENHELSEEVVVPEGLTRIPESKTYVQPGQKFTVGDLLTILLVGSSNDAAETLARHHSGSERAFVHAMNARTASLGLQRTSFANASGFDNARQWSTSRDVALLASFVLREPELRQRLSMRDAIVKDSTGQEIVLSHTHELLHTVPSIVAGKTGTTLRAGQCLLSIVRDGDREYVVVILGSRERYADMHRILQALGQLFV